MLGLAFENHAQVGAVVFYLRLDVCILRAEQRTNHLTLNPQTTDVEAVIRSFARRFEYPSLDEGLRFIREIREDTNIFDIVEDLL